MILGHDIMSEHKITLNFKDQTMTWDDSTINMKDPEALLDLLDPVNDFFWNNDQHETEVLHKASNHLQKNLHAKYELVDLDEVAWACNHMFELFSDLEYGLLVTSCSTFEEHLDKVFS